MLFYPAHLTFIMTAELSRFEGKQIIICDNEKTRNLGIAGGVGLVEAVRENVLSVIFTGFGGPAGPYELEERDIEWAE